jgi:hypothetical protein
LKGFGLETTFLAIDSSSSKYPTDETVLWCHGIKGQFRPR